VHQKKKTPSSADQLGHLGRDDASIKGDLTRHMRYSVGKDPLTATRWDWFFTSAHVVRDRLIERWMETMGHYYHTDAKRVYYLSLEFLIGRTLTTSLLNLGMLKDFHAALENLDKDYDTIRDMEPDAALGNGGLGRLAACFLDSMATRQIPGYGYGIRYDYGMFKQHIENGYQVEHPDNWLRYGSPWEFARPEVLFRVQLYGRVVQYQDGQGNLRYDWRDTEDIMAMAYDMPIPGYDTDTVNNLRLWSAKASRDFDLKYFNEGNYIKAVEDKNESENLSKVLYPADTTETGRELRLKQQYFFVCASLADIFYRFTKQHDHFDALPDKVAIQLNDTHPAIAIPELMRVLVDTHHLDWDKAWDITTRTFSYTNHTLMPEALETWPVPMFERMLPRHLQIIYEINHRFLKEVKHRYPGDVDMLRRMSILDEEGGKRVRMAHLAIVGSHTVNGVARLHTELMKKTIFADFHRFYPDKLVNVTNGITPRRWLDHSNPKLSELISSHIGRKWITELDQLKQLEPLADDAGFRKKFLAVKRENKARLAEYIQEHARVEVNPTSLFDVQVKRVHEYKRQLLNLLHVVTLYNRLRTNPKADRVPRTVIFAGKAAPGYYLAKLTIKLINDVAEVINHDPAVSGKLKLVFIPNYDVTTAGIIIPAADLSQQISTAGTEASGTGNMKLALNGALTIGTLDGANIEIQEEVGKDNIFIFGNTADQIAALGREGYNPWAYYHADGELRQALDMIQSGYFCLDEPQRFQPIFDALTAQGDRYFLLADYAAYLACQEKVDALYRKPQEWARKAILNVARMGKFSSDRSIREYAEKIWQVKPISHE